MSANKGAYSVNYYGSYKNAVGVYITQGYLGILYNSARLDSKDYNQYAIPYLILPHTCQINHIDFFTQVKSQGLEAPMWLDFDPDNIEYLWKSVLRYNDELKFNLSLAYINAIIDIIEATHKSAEDYKHIYREKESIERKLI